MSSSAGTVLLLVMLSIAFLYEHYTQGMRTQCTKDKEGWEIKDQIMCRTQRDTRLKETASSELVLITINVYLGQYIGHSYWHWKGYSSLSMWIHFFHVPYSGVGLNHIFDNSQAVRKVIGCPFWMANICAWHSLSWNHLVFQLTYIRMM